MADPQTPDISSLSVQDGDFVLTGKQEHYLKRELISRQVKFEISELNSPTALQRFGAPFKSPLGDVDPLNSELPILRYIFVNHVRNFPFLDQAKEEEFWQGRLQVFLESFATKRISSSEDRHEETKRRKLALKCEKVVELMMNSGIPTASGYEERVGFDEIEAAGGADRGAQDEGLLANVPEGNEINGWDVNVACVRQMTIRRNIRYHAHAEFVLRSKRHGQPDVVVGRRYGAFTELHRELRKELPGKMLPPVPGKIKTSQSTRSSLLTAAGFASVDDDASSLDTVSSESSSVVSVPAESGSSTPRHKKSHSLGSTLKITNGSKSKNASRTSLDNRASVDTDRTPPDNPVNLWRENQRISLRAFIRSLLRDPQIARSQAMAKFLLDNPIKLNEEEQLDEAQRRAMDEIRLEEQRKFYELTRQRARELDVYMESFRKDIVDSNGLTKLFAEIREKDKLEDLSIQYKKFAEWLRIEVAATIYHIFLAEDNSAELFEQGRRIHKQIPYSILREVLRFANPTAVMTGISKLFLAVPPWGSHSLMQTVLSSAINSGIKRVQKSIDSLITKIDDPVLCNKLKLYTEADDSMRAELQRQSNDEDTDLIVVILRSEFLGVDLEPRQIEKVFNSYVAYTSAVHNIHDDIKSSAQYFSYLKQLLKMYTRQRDKQMMLAIIGEPVTLQLFRDLFDIFYKPLVRVYNAANVYNSVIDFKDFVDDIIETVKRAKSHDMSTDPNVTVQSFIDLCARHEDKFYYFVHEVHIHDDGLFTNLMGWLEGILAFLRNGPQSGRKLDMNALFQNGVESGAIDREMAKNEINALIDWQAKRRRWHEAKTRQKMAADQETGWKASAPVGLSPKDFGIGEADLESLQDVDDDQSEDEDEADDALGDPIVSERKKRSKQAELLRRRAGEPEKPEIVELGKLMPGFLDMLRGVLAQ